MSEINLIYITCKDKSEAKNIAKTLLKEKLIACANIYDDATSYYWWKDEIQKDKEAILICKTTESLANHTINKVKELHSYDCPCILCMKIDSGNEEYFNWVKSQTSNSKKEN